MQFHFLYFAQFPCRATKNAPLTEADAAGLRKPPSELLGCGPNAGIFSLKPPCPCFRVGFLLALASFFESQRRGGGSVGEGGVEKGQII